MPSRVTGRVRRGVSPMGVSHTALKCNCGKGGAAPANGKTRPRAGAVRSLGYTGGSISDLSAPGAVPWRADEHTAAVRTEGERSPLPCGLSRAVSSVRSLPCSLFRAVYSVQSLPCGLFRAVSSVPCALLRNGGLLRRRADVGPSRAIWCDLIRSGAISFDLVRSRAISPSSPARRGTSAASLRRSTLQTR